MDQDDIVDVLNDLIENCRDGEYGFESCAEHVKSAELRDTFVARAAECRAAASELQILVSECGGTPDEGGSVSGAVHRGWVAVKGTLAGYSDIAMLEECERGEDVAKARYKKALENNVLPEPIRSVIERQYQGVLRNHDQVRMLRDRFRAAA
ncbi:MAG: PA2169 family four-helix-bundle protein [Acidobacteriota bacterium]